MDKDVHKVWERSLAPFARSKRVLRFIYVNVYPPPPRSVALGLGPHTITCHCLDIFAGFFHMFLVSISRL